MEKLDDLLKKFKPLYRESDAWRVFQPSLATEIYEQQWYRLITEHFPDSMYYEEARKRLK